jgi:RNA polymerase sigma-70 factor (ECF subfamily)
MTDADLTRRVRLQDHDAFATLYQRHAGPVYSVARSVLRDEAVAEEVVHDVFLNLWRQPQSYDPSRGNFQGWLLRVARNRSIDLLRQRRDVPFPTSHGGDDGDAVDGMTWIPDPDPDPADQAVSATTADAVRGALGTLPREHRILLELAYFGGLTQREIALKVNRPLGTVKTQMRSAMRRLADVLRTERGTTSADAPIYVDTVGEGDETLGPGRGRRQSHAQLPNEGRTV